ncbi:hypothetical protein BU25DRAFT_227146 [Macroventuria anomochaeta]|uniref:Uncharacterized protein n=1 Tax=Macroventuria anomochaeta TaxID=301207 RepID=A0ACB6SAH2_9PLEO|nr:uncharacterized protein BU25DRAFT_227146 [Macroventuria anomochaeta]KAF2631290.1 hypothetical protein BU25DRAFT_227146 [Macroventuria anomochaeta]
MVKIRRLSRFIGVSILLVGSIAALGVGPAWPVLISELSSVRLRAKSPAIRFMTNALAGVAFSISVPYMFNDDVGNWDARSVSYSLSCASSALAYLGCSFLRPRLSRMRSWVTCSRGECRQGNSRRYMASTTSSRGRIVVGYALVG